jgi:RNA-binding protein
MNTKQRAFLRGKANGLETILYIGKSGINENIIKQADEALTARELIKGAVQENAPISAAEALHELCARTDAQPVQSIGRRFVLYRESEEKLIKLPR